MLSALLLSVFGVVFASHSSSSPINETIRYHVVYVGVYKPFTIVLQAHSCKVKRGPPQPKNVNVKAISYILPQKKWLKLRAIGFNLYLELIDTKIFSLNSNIILTQKM